MIELYNSHHYFDFMQLRMITFLPRYFPAVCEHLEGSPAGGTKWFNMVKIFDRIQLLRKGKRNYYSQIGRTFRFLQARWSKIHSRKL